jgi:hypothetical protein
MGWSYGAAKAIPSCPGRCTTPMPVPIHLDRVRHPTPAGRDPALDRLHWLRVRQRPSRNHHRPYKIECIRDGSPFHAGLGDMATSSSPPLNGCTGTTPPGSCTASAADHPWKPKPSTTLNTNKTNRSHTYQSCASNPGCFTAGRAQTHSHAKERAFISLARTRWRAV